MASLFSEVKVYPTNSDSGVVGRGSAVISNALKVNFSLYKGSNGIFVMLPAEKDKNGKVDPKTKKPVYYPHASFINAAAREELNTLAVNVYMRMKEGGSVDSPEGNYDDSLPF